MTEQTQPWRDDPLLAGAIRLVGHLRRAVLTNPGRRAAVQAAVRREPGDPRTFRAMREVADFLPEDADFHVQHAFLAVAAMMCDQPARARTEDAAQAQESDGDQSTGDTSAGESAPSGDDPGQGRQGRAARSRSLGASCAYAVNQGAHSESTMETRLHAICRSRVSDAHRQLPGLVSFLRGEGSEVNWVRLIVDLSVWERSRQRVAARWLRHYYRDLPADKKNTDEQESA